MTEPPSLRIAGELRARIVSGELAPGERVPSAREITRRWGVAVATASRVLAALRDEGLVRAVPGVGTVVLPRPAAPRGSSAAPRAEQQGAVPDQIPPTDPAAPGRPATPGGGTPDRTALEGAASRGREATRRRTATEPATPGALESLGSATSPAGAGEATGGPAEWSALDQGHRQRAPGGLSVGRIVATAVAIADAEGLDGLSMRRVASELGAGPMSLYRHVADKDDLLLRMLDATLRDARLPDDPPPGWRARLEVAARSLWAAFQRHPWLASALSLTRPQAIAGGLAYTEWVLTALEESGLTSTVAFDVHLTFFTFVRGIAVNLESEAAAQAASGLTGEEWVNAQEQALLAILEGGRFPRFERLVNQEYDLDLDTLFERGLRYLLDGLAADLAGDRPRLGP